MPTTAQLIRTTVCHINWYGLHTGNEFADQDSSRLDICAAVYCAAEDTIPAAFYTDEDAAIRLIEASAPTMQAIRAISAGLDTAPCTTEIAPGMEVPDYIEHVSNWAATRGIGADHPPTETEVMGRLLRIADALDAQHQTAHRPTAA